MSHARVYAQQGFFYSPEASGTKWQLVRNGLTTSQVSASGVTDTNTDSGAALTYVGNYWIRITSGVCAGEWQRIVEDDGSGAYIAEEPFSATIASGVYFEIWSSPESIATAGSGNLATTTFEDTSRTEANDYWNGYVAYALHGVNAGLARSITDFVSSGGVFTTDAFPAAHAEGDIILLVKWIDIEPTTPGLQQAFHPRPGKRDNLSKGKGTVGARAGEFGFTSQVYGSGTLAASGSAANPSVLSGLLPACGFEEVVDTSSTTAAGSSTTVIKVATGSHENHTIGGFVMINGNVRPVTDKDDNGASADDITVSPALPVAPAASQVLYALRSYKPKTTGDVPAVTLYHDIDGLRHVMTGCKGNVAFSEANGLVQAAWTFSVDHWIRQFVVYTYTGQGVYTSASPVVSDAMQAYIDTTATNIGGLTASLNAVMAPRDVRGAHGINGRHGFQMTDYNPGGSFRELVLTDDAQHTAEQRFLRQTSFSLLAIMGANASAFVMRSPVSAIEELPQTGNSNGMVEAPEVWRSKDAGQAIYDTDNGGTDDTVVKVPDFAIGLT